MFKITNILNPLTGGATTTEYKLEKGEPLSTYMGYREECVVMYNGGIISLPVDEIFPAENDEYLVMPIPTGGDEGTWRSLGQIMGTATSFIPGAWILPLTFAGANLLFYFLREKDKDLSTSPSYSWQHRGNPSAAHGSAMPIIYGKARIRPVLKNRYVKIDGDRQKLYALYSIAAHRVDERTDVYTYAQFVHEIGVRGTAALYGVEYSMPVAYGELPAVPGATLFHPTTYKNGIPGHGMASFYNDIVINGRSISTYGDDVQWETRPGLAAQTIITGFEATYSNIPADIELYLEAPEVSMDAVNLVYSAESGRIKWSAHTIKFNGIEVDIVKGSRAVEFDHDYYLHYRPTISANRYYTSDNVVPSSVDSYIIAKFQVAPASDKFHVSDRAIYDRDTYKELPSGSNWIYPVTLIQNAHNIELTLTLPHGLFTAAAGENIMDGECRIFAQYRVENTDTWTNFDFNFAESVDHSRNYANNINAGIITRVTTKPINLSIRAVPETEPLTYGANYEMRVAASSTSLVKLVNVAKIVYGEEDANGKRQGFTYPGEPLLGIKALASGQISSDLDVQVDVERSKVWVWNTRLAKILTTVKITLYATTNYIRIKGWYGDWDDFQVGQLIMISGAVLNNGVNNGMYKIKDKAANMPAGYHILYLDSDYSTITINENGAMTTRMTLAQGWVQGDANIHAWAVYDILVNGYYNSDTGFCHPTYPYAGNENGEAVYGCGVNPAYIDYESFREWAEYTGYDGLKYELNIVFDTFMTAWDAILRICQEGRGIVYPVGTKIYAMAYRDSDPVQLFTMGNIHADTFAQKYMESRQRANMLEVKYWDEERNYEETVLAARTENWDSDASLNKPTSITLYGTTNYSQAYQTARFTMLMEELLNNIITFGVDVDSLASQVGDVVEVGHDVLGTGSSGRIVSYTDLSGSTNSVTLDRTVTAAVGDVLQVKHSDGTIESNTVDAATTSATLHFATAWTTAPALHDIYSLGTPQKYRIIEISRTDELMRTLTLMQYDENAYITISDDDNDGEFSLPKLVPPSTSVGDVANILNLASNVKLQEVVSRNRTTGEYEPSVVVTFDSMPPPAPRGTWEIYVRDVDASDINWKGTWEDNTVYDTHEKVELNGKTFISLSDNNTTTPFKVGD